MAVSTQVLIDVTASETRTQLLGAASSAPHRITWPHPNINGGSPVFASGTGDNQWDRVYEYAESLASTTRAIDLSGSLTQELAATAFSPVELCGIVVCNDATTATKILKVGAGSNPCFSGLWMATGDGIIVPAGGVFCWFAPLDGGGAVVTNSTADILTLDSASNTVPYRLLLLGRSA